MPSPMPVSNHPALLMYRLGVDRRKTTSIPSMRHETPRCIVIQIEWQSSPYYGTGFTAKRLLWRVVE